MRKCLAAAYRNASAKRLRAIPTLCFLLITSPSLFAETPVDGNIDSAKNDIDVPAATYGTYADAAVVKARSDVDKIKGLVDQGALPRRRLDQALAALADAEDDAILARTLYGSSRVEQLSAEDAQLMVEAAQRRVERQRAVVDERERWVRDGVLAKGEIQPQAQELEMRNRTLELALSRERLQAQLAAMAKAEEELEKARDSGILPDAMVRFDGNATFRLEDLKTIQAEYEKHFHAQLPVSALGQTFVHQTLGFDHHDRVDVALTPDQAEGVWLRQLLERLHVPYIAFRQAIAGSATAPHIHIGIPSTRLKIAGRS
jgi:hypothetical protein